MFLRHTIPAIFILFSFYSSCVANGLIVAERGGGAALIENTLPALSLAAASGVEYLELQVVMSGDDELLVFNDLTLNRLTNVAELFPDRSREDGSDYVVDFTVGEIRQLRLRNVFEYGQQSLSLGIPTLREYLSLVRRLENLQNRQLGLVLEVVAPRFHKDSGKDISEAVLDTLFAFKFTGEESRLYLECSDPDELQRIHSRLLPEKQMHLPLIQLVGENVEHLSQDIGNGWLFTNIGLRLIASYGAAVALPTSKVVAQDGTLLLERYIEDIHKYGLKVFVRDVNGKDKLPSFVSSYETLLEFYHSRMKIDGIFTESYKEAIEFQKKQEALEELKKQLPVLAAPVELTEPLQPAGPEEGEEQ